MPYQTFRQNGRYCNHKVDADGNPVGDSLGCFNSASEAREQVEALYASEDKDLIKSEPIKASFTVKKDADGRSRWIAQFSNNVRDDDHPPEILSSEAHRKFAYLLDKGFVPMPELWIFHEKEWSVGEADWVAVDEHDGFTFMLASGYFHPYAEEVASALALEKDVALSHGMYPHLIERNDDDKTIITGYVSREITVLPREMAANKLTAYASTESKMVKEEKRRSLAERWPGLGEDLLSRIEAANKSAKEVAEELRLQTKDGEGGDTETEVEGAEAKKEAEEITEATAETEHKEESPDGGEEKKMDDETKTVTFGDVAELVSVIGERFDKLEKSQAAALSQIMERVEGLEANEKARREISRGQSLAEMFLSKSVEGKDEAKVDGRTELGKDGPAENKEQEGTGLFFEEFLRS